MFEAVQQHLARGTRRHREAGEQRVAKAMLTGRIFDACGEAMSPAFSYGRGGRVYRYYVSASLQQGGSRAGDGVLRRIAAPAIEQLVTDSMARLLPALERPAERLLAVRLRSDTVTLTLSVKLMRDLRPHLSNSETLHADPGRSTCDIIIPITLPLRGGRRRISTGQTPDANPDARLIAALRRAHAMLDKDAGGPTIAAAPCSPYERRVLRLAFLAPDIQRGILAGHQPQHCNLEFLMRCELPLAWAKQHETMRWTVQSRSPC